MTCQTNRPAFLRTPCFAINLLFILSMLVLSLTASASEDNGTEPAPTGLFDEAGVLNEDESQEIENRIDDVEAAGAPTVVYLRLMATEEDRAVEDGQRLMEEWGIESEPGARDGFVIYLNLNPEDPNRGELGIVAGETHYDGGALPQSELDRIRDEMIDYLADDRMADGIVHGLELTAEQLRAGPPEPGAFESFVQQIAEGPISVLNIIAVLIAAMLGVAGWRRWADRPRSRQLGYASTIELPEDLHPAIAGALESGRVRHPQVEATAIVLGQRGALRFEPDPENDEKVQIRLLDGSRAETAFEQRLLEVLSKRAREDVLTQDEIAEAQSDWSDVEDVIRGDLQQRGWFDPKASRRRRPLIIYGIVMVVLVVLALLALAWVEEPWLLVGIGALFIAALVLFSLAASYPSTTVEGERAAAPWRAYRQGLYEAKDDESVELDLDSIFPYIVALGLAGGFHERLETASERGYIPAWFHLAEHQTDPANTWFIYWVALHHSMTPQSSSSGTGAGGAAAGSGGAGGQF